MYPSNNGNERKSRKKSTTVKINCTFLNKICTKIYTFIKFQRKSSVGCLKSLILAVALFHCRYFVFILIFFVIRKCHDFFK